MNDNRLFELARDAGLPVPWWAKARDADEDVPEWRELKKFANLVIAEYQSEQYEKLLKNIGKMYDDDNLQ